jgi:hypothetical protein
MKRWPRGVDAIWHQRNPSGCFDLAGKGDSDGLPRRRFVDIVHPQRPGNTEVVADADEGQPLELLLEVLCEVFQGDVRVGLRGGHEPPLGTALGAEVVVLTREGVFSAIDAARG